MVAALALGLTACATAPEKTPLPLDPMPTHVEYRNGYFHLRSGAPLLVGSLNARADGIAHRFVIELGKRRGIHLDIHSSGTVSSVASGIPPGRRDAVVFSLDFNNIYPPTGKGYKLVIGRHRILLAARTPEGLSRGADALLQLLTATKVRAHRELIPNLLIVDDPHEKKDG